MLEDVEQEEPKQQVTEIKEEPWPQNKEKLELLNTGVSLTHLILSLPQDQSGRINSSTSTGHNVDN